MEQEIVCISSHIHLSNIVSSRVHTNIHVTSYVDKLINTESITVPVVPLDSQTQVKRIGGNCE